MKTPWTPQQIVVLNQLQENSDYHPYTCCGEEIAECERSKAYEDRRNGKEVPYNHKTEGVLKATENGWICPCGKYKQDWAHG